MKTFLFPGQGSQARGMGKHLFARHRAMTEVADRVLGYSIEELCVDDPRKELNHTQFTQPAIFVVNALAYQDRIAQEGRPDFLAGHSLGEFNALLAAESFDFETGLHLVQRRAQLMSRTAEGAMAAILNASRAEIEAILIDNHLDEIDIANLNTPAQVVISGSKTQIARAESCFGQGLMQYIPLNTSGAFHSRYMAPAREQFEAFLAGFKFRKPRIPVIANVTASAYEDDQVASLLGRQLTGSVRWCESIEYLKDLAADAGDTMLFTEVGHGDVLTRMLPKIQGQNRRDANPATLVAAANASVAVAVPAAERVQRWNNTHRIGTRVRSRVVDGLLETRTEAVLLFQHRAAVYVQGYNGYFDIDELTVA